MKNVHNSTRIHETMRQNGWPKVSMNCIRIGLNYFQAEILSDSPACYTSIPHFVRCTISGRLYMDGSLTNEKMGMISWGCDGMPLTHTVWSKQNARYCFTGKPDRIVWRASKRLSTTWKELLQLGLASGCRQQAHFSNWTARRFTKE